VRGGDDLYIGGVKARTPKCFTALTSPQKQKRNNNKQQQQQQQQQNIIVRKTRIATTYNTTQKQTRVV
jgi:hypothetical protein